MSRRAEKRRRAAALARRRDDLKEAVDQVRGALGDVGGAGLGRVRVGAPWVLPVAAGVAGIAIAWTLSRFRTSPVPGGRSGAKE